MYLQASQVKMLNIELEMGFGKKDLLAIKNSIEYTMRVLSMH